MEEAVTFGADDGLLGVYTPAQGDLCCLLMNAGVIHRIGPHRLNVKLARGLAEGSVASLRFDLSGLGDSRPPSGSASYTEQSVVDLRAAMDFVERRYGKKRFVIFGICSGAVNAQRAALADARVAGIFMLDGFWYTSRWTRTALLWARLRAHSPKTLLGAVLRKLFRRRHTAAAPVAPKKVEIFATDGSGNPPKPQFIAEMEQLTTRGVDVFFLYSGSVDDLVSYRGQLRDAFPGAEFIRRSRIERHPDLDHTAMTQHSQKKMVAMVRDWARGVAGRDGG
jgi:pimeloyl-ACP methyl ester carboxylesterase